VRIADVFLTACAPPCYDVRFAENRARLAITLLANNRELGKLRQVRSMASSLCAASLPSPKESGAMLSWCIQACSLKKHRGHSNSRGAGPGNDSSCLWECSPRHWLPISVSIVIKAPNEKKHGRCCDRFEGRGKESCIQIVHVRNGHVTFRREPASGSEGYPWHCFAAGAWRVKVSFAPLKRNNVAI